MPRLGAVLEERRRGVLMGDRHVEVAIAVVIGQGDTAADKLLVEVGPGGAAAVLEALAVEAEQLPLHLQQRIAGVVLDMPVGHDQVLAAIGIEVGHRRAEAEARKCRLVEPDKPGHVLEAARPEVAVERV